MKGVLAKMILAIGLALWAVGATDIKAQVATADFYWGQGCPHCAQEKIFLDKLASIYGDKLEIREFEIYYNQDNAVRFEQVISKFKIEPAGVPLLVVGEEYVVGFGDEETTGKRIRQIIENNFSAKVEEDNFNSQPLYLNIFSKRYDLKTMSLPVATAMIAFVDGFNPCAMWILVFLITMLVNLKDKKRLYVLGTTFILTSGVMYFGFLAAWFNFFKLVGYVGWIKVLVGVVAIISGISHIKNGLNAKRGCKAVNQDQRSNIMGRIKKVLGQKGYGLAILGITGLAVSVNLIELVCSAGLPAVYSSLLASTDLSTGAYYSYLVFYTLIFMLDDLAIFLVAVKTFEVSGISSKYSRFSGVIGGVLILVIGVALIVKPELLMFK